MHDSGNNLIMCYLCKTAYSILFIYKLDFKVSLFHITMDVV